ncbi:hypothetical protein BS47DRAFT_1296878 [Hydnum rufescens UP504]|uniref:Peptidase A1 domain-containing protein n=1 Tax=Hydnum rufescens UP504 TaxID=1448309 RepID=A0A9P6AW17_9AGAM|nr:hypothetical protein BS47DRAFT_1296878 [Hydnum rufescens UP504]
MRFRSDSTQVATSFLSIDYGTTLIVGDTAFIAAFYVVIPGSNDGSETVPNGLYAYRRSSNPLVSLTFEGISYPASPVAFDFGQLSAGSSDGVGEVVVWNPWFWIVRDVFMRGMGTVFDFDNSRDGFASLA